MSSPLSFAGKGENSPGSGACHRFFFKLGHRLAQIYAVQYKKKWSYQQELVVRLALEMFTASRTAHSGER